MEALAREMLPFAAPLMNYLHGRFLRYFIEQDVVGHMETDLDGERSRAGADARRDRLRRPRRLHPLTEEHGDEEALAWSSASSRPSSRRCRPTRA